MPHYPKPLRLAHGLVGAFFAKSDGVPRVAQHQALEGYYDAVNDIG